MPESKQGSVEGQSALDRYHAILNQSAARLDALRARDRRFAAARLTLFAGALLVLTFAFFSSVGSIGWVTGWGLLAAFLVAAILNEPVRDAMRAEQRSSKVTKRLIARCNRDWDSLDWKSANTRLKTVELGEHEQDVADDLDLLGRSSLFQFVSMAGTTVGVRTLANWLTGGANAGTAKARSQAVESLATRRDDRMRFYSLATHVGEGAGDPDQFVRWSQDEPWLDRHRWLVMWANVAATLALIAIAILIASRLGLVSTNLAQIALIVGGAVAVINFALTSVMLGPVHEVFAIAMSSRQAVDEYTELFAAAQWLSDEQSTQSARLKHLHHVLLDDPDQSARVGMQALSRIAARGSLRTSAATYLLYLPLQAFALWDVRVFRRLESWQKQFRDSVPKWFDAFGELEALMSLAAVCDENPSWVFPQWSESQTGDPQDRQFQSVGLGHPLLADSDRVCNDVVVGPPGTVLLVTGSNMSGKSTMLRSVGLNVALAGAGAPVCATSLRLPSIELATSIRVRDNLAEGVSFYMAELHRLKGVVDRARALQDDPDQISLFLLDEILQGTNSRERQIAVTQVLRHLIECGAIGAISTHDLELADEPELSRLSEIVHFRETITPDATGNEQMTFDYQMRNGVSPTTNALRLLEIVGLGRSE